MKGNLYINDKDAWLFWSAGLVSGSYNNLMLPAPTKEYGSNNMRSQDGTQVFVTNPRLTERDIILTFGIVCESTEDYLSKYQSFLEELSKGLILLKVPVLKTTYKLLFTSATELTTGSELMNSTISIRFREPNPKDRIKL